MNSPLFERVRAALFGEDPGRCEALVAELRWIVGAVDTPLALRRALRGVVDDLVWSLEEPAIPSRPWESVPDALLAPDIPGMLHPDCARFYRWLGTHTDGPGAWLELGAWMGRLTTILAQALESLDRDAELHVFDAFVWHSWMDDHLHHWPADIPRPSPGDDIRGLFERFCGGLGSRVRVHQAQLSRGGDFGAVPDARWAETPIRVLITDLWDDHATTALTWDVFGHALVPNRSILVFNQYGNLRSGDVRAFARAHRSYLRPLYKPLGPTKAFLYTSPSVARPRSTESIAGGA